MKKLTYIIALAAVLFSGSCQQEKLNVSKDASTVTFAVKVPEYAVTKTSGSDVISNINNIVYAVYKTDAESLEDARISLAGKTPVNCVNPMAEDPRNTTVFVNNNANISVELFNDQKYIILFWAQVDQTWVEGTDFDLTNITYPDYLEANQSKYEAFCGAAYVEKVKGSRSESVELSRPHAQINIASAPTGFPVDIQTSKVKISGAGASFNVATGKASGNTDITFKKSNNPEGTFSTAYPHYIASNYVFANGNVSVEYELTANLGTISRFENPISNVPVARNYKTNIVGNLLSNEIDYSVSLTDTWGTPDTQILLASNEEELLEAFKVGGYIRLTEDIELTAILKVESGKEVHLDMNGKTINVSKASKVDPVFQPNSGASLIIEGNGKVFIEDSWTSLIVPYGNCIINDGVYIRNAPTSSDKIGDLFLGLKNSSSVVKIYGGYFDGGYYDDNAADIEDYLNGKTLEEEKGKSVRDALKKNVSTLMNLSANKIRVFGGTFVGANPAWGDEGCMLPTTPNKLRPSSYDQGPFLDGQIQHDDSVVLPEGYTITKGSLEDGRPIYTVSYTKPESDATTPELPNE